MSPGAASLIVEHPFAKVTLERCVTGPLHVAAGDAEVILTDCIVDAGAPENVAYAADAAGGPGAELSLRDIRPPPADTAGTTIIGKVHTKLLRLASNSIFFARLGPAPGETWIAPLIAQRRQKGCVRFCYVPPGCRTPRRYNCQPDLVEQAAEAAVRADAQDSVPVPGKDELADAIAAARQREHIRVRPQFNSVRYGAPTYCQLAETCADEIKRGADDQSEMGVFHDLFQPQRTANLRARLDEYTPAATSAGIIFAS